MSDCIFCKIISGHIPSKKVYEDELVFGFEDNAPAAPVHCLFVPKEHFASTNDVHVAHANVVGRLFVAAARVAAEKGVDLSGYRLVCNNGRDAGQVVFHLHLHLLGGRPMGSLT